MKNGKVSLDDLVLRGTKTERIPSEKLSTLKVTSIFLSVDGEVNPLGQGAWSIFVRLSGCSAGCSFCDTKYSWKDGDELAVMDILSEIKKIGQGVKKITLTGGEPLESSGKALTTLIQELLLDGYYITIETNGLHSPDELLQVASIMGRNRQLSMILDWKLPSAGKVSEKIMRNHYVDLPNNCFVKFVISDENDFREALEAASFIRKTSDAQIYFSPCGGSLTPETLFQWMKASLCPSWRIGYNLQLHKYLFSDDWRDEEQS